MVGLIAPANLDDDPSRLQNAIDTVEGMGLVLMTGRHVFGRFGDCPLAGIGSDGGLLGLRSAHAVHSKSF